MALSNKLHDFTYIPLELLDYILYWSGEYSSKLVGK